MKVIILFLGIIMCVVGGVVIMVNDYKLEMLQSGAEVASTASGVCGEMQKLVSIMEKQGMTSGYADRLFNKYEMTPVFLKVQELTNYASELSKIDTTSGRYKSGLKELKKNIGELDTHTFHYWLHHNPVWPVITMLGFLFFLFSVVKLGD